MDFTETSCSNPLVDWPSVNCCPPPELVSQQDKSGLVAPVVLPENQNLLQPLSVQPEMDSSCMEIEAAQRKLQEIEDRYGWTWHAETDRLTNMKNILHSAIQSAIVSNKIKTRHVP